jgi:hypothetical protein
MLPDDIKAAVSRQPGRVLREDPESARHRLEQLGVSESSLLGRFYLEFQGPFPFGMGSEELLDIDNRVVPSIVDTTKFANAVLGLPSHFICITSPEGEGFVLYDKRTESVYDTGVDELPALLSGDLQPRWKTFFDYLRDYFREIRKPTVS